VRRSPTFRRKGKNHSSRITFHVSKCKLFSETCQPSHKPKHFHEDSEEKANAIAAVTTAFVLRQWEWIDQNNFVDWCREQLLIAAKRPEPPAEFHDGGTRYLWGYRRSAARALPVLFSRNPEDREIRKAIIRLAGHRNEEVRAYLFNSLKVLWNVSPETIWSCINAVIKDARRIAVESKFRYSKRRLSKAINILLCRLRTNTSIRNLTVEDISSHHLQSVLYALPLDNQISSVATLPKVISFIDDLLQFTINAYLHFQKEDRHYHYNEWSHYDWNRLFFRIVANALLRLPKDVAEARLLNPILDNWEKAPALMEEFLRQFILVGAQPELEPRLVELWLHVGDKVLYSSHCKSLGYYIPNEMRHILGLLIFSDPTGIIKFNAEEWVPLKEMKNFISHWCQTVGHHQDCFPSLVRLLRTVGFNLMPDFGIRWIHECLNKVDNQKDFFKRSRTANSLAELLHDSWANQRESIEKNAANYKLFALIVDQVAAQGESIAVQLQTKIQKTLVRDL
jgi:hypothetical protein